MDRIVIAPVAEAVRYHDAKTPVGSKLRSGEWLQAIPVQIREASQASAAVESARYLERIQGGVGDILGHRRNEFGGITDRSGLIRDLIQLAEREGLRPPEGDAKRGTIQDVGSEARTELIYQMQTGSAYGYANWQAGQDPDMLDAYPAQELVRVRDAKVPRNWAVRWAEAGQKVGWVGAAKAPFVALKNSPIWVALSRFERAFPPFDFGSGMWVEDVDRETAVNLGLLKVADQVQPQAKPFTENWETSVKDLSPELRESLRKAFPDRVVIEGDTAKWRRPPGAQAIEEDHDQRKPDPSLPQANPAPDANAEAIALGIKARYPSEDVGRAANRTLVAIKEEFGYAPKSIETDREYFRTRFGARSVTRTAAYDADIDTIWLNPDSPFWHKRIDRALELHLNGHWSTPSPEHPILHELGHALHARKSPEIYRQSAAGQVFLPEVALRDLRGKVSKYALTSVTNFVAETFAGLRVGMQYGDEVLRWYRYFGGP